MVAECYLQTKMALNLKDAKNLATENVFKKIPTFCQYILHT